MPPHTQRSYILFIDLFLRENIFLNDLNYLVAIELTEAEDIKKRCQEYIEELYKKDLNDLDNHD